MIGKDFFEDETIPNGKMDLDTDEYLLKQGDRRESWNMRFRKNKAPFFNIPAKILGNSKPNTVFVQPPGINRAIGTFEVRNNNSVLTANYNSLGRHQWRRYVLATNEIQVIAESPDFNWEIDKLITSIDIVDDLLFWTDTRTRKLDIKKAYTGNKKLESNIYVLNGSFVVTVSLPNGNTASELFLVGTTVDQALARLQGNTTMVAGLSFIKCNGYIEVTQLTPNNGYGISKTLGTGGIVVPQNYFYNIVEQHFDAVKIPFNLSPRIELKYNANVTYNYLSQKTFQFRARPVYDNNERAVLSAISDIAINPFDRKLNYCTIDITTSWLNDPNLLSLIKGVDLFVREGNTGAWKLIKKLKQSELWVLGAVGLNTFDFYNDGYYPVISDIEAEKQYDSMPIGPIDSQYTIGQTLFDNRIGYGTYKSWYEQPCDNSSIKVGFDPLLNVRLFNLEVTLRIFSDLQFDAGSNADVDFPPNANGHGSQRAIQKDYNSGRIGAIYRGEPTGSPPVAPEATWGAAYQGGVKEDYARRAKQILPLNGWPIYLAGYNYFGITKQVASTDLVYNLDGTLDASSSAAKDQIRDWYRRYDSQTQYGDMLSLGIIPGVPAGKYPVRVASHRCRFGDSEDGFAYNLNNGLVYQRTSSNVAGWYDPNNNYNQIGDFEMFISIEPNGDWEISSPGYGIVKSGTAGADNSIIIGEVVIRDLVGFRDDETDPAHPNIVTDGFPVTGYLYDGIIRNNVVDVSQGTPIEGQEVQWMLTPSNGDYYDPATITIGDFSWGMYSCITDYNGYFYLPHGGGYAGFQGPSRTIGANGQIINKLTDNYFRGTLSNLFADTLVPAVTDPATLSQANGVIFPPFQPLPGSPTSTNVDVILSNTNTDFHNDYRTLITGTVEDSNGVPITGVSVVYQRTGRNTQTDDNGQFGIIAYAISYPNTINNYLFRDGKLSNNWQFWRLQALGLITTPVDRVLDDIIFNPPLNYFAFYSILLPVNIISFINNYNNSNPYSPLLFNPLTVVVSYAQSRKQLKMGGKYQFAKMWVDTANRRCDIVVLDPNYIPFWTENIQDYYPLLPNTQAIGTFNFTLDLTGETPPPWADKLYLLRVKNQIQAGYIQFPAFAIKYVISFTRNETSTSIEETVYETQTANRLWIGIPQSLLAYNDYQTGSLKTWVFKPGDRLRFKNLQDGTYATSYIDVPILAVSPDGNYFIIPNELAFPKLDAGAVFEVYSPKLESTTKIFYEIPVIVDIVNGQYTQTVVPINTGDTYRRIRTVPILNSINTSYIEDEAVSDFYPSTVEDIGRENVVTDFTTELQQTNQICFSNKYFSGTQINGLSSFDADNVVQTPQRIGRLTFIKTTTDDAFQQVVLAAHQNGCITFYVGAAQLIGANGPDITVTTSSVLGSYRTLVGDFGCMDAASMVSRDGYLAWHDPIRGVFIRYARNGITPISDYGFQYNASQIPITAKVIATYDAFHKQIVWCIKDASGSYSVAYDNEEDNRGWSGFFNIVPDMFGTIGNKLYAFKDGELWLQESNVLTANFFGVQYSCSVRMVFNQKHKTMKAWTNVAIYASSLWYCPEIANRYGQLSRLVATKMVKQENVYNAAIMRNLNDTAFPTPADAIMNGEHMRSETINILFQNDDDKFGVIFSAIAASTMSPITPP